MHVQSLIILTIVLLKIFLKNRVSFISRTDFSDIHFWLFSVWIEIEIPKITDVKFAFDKIVPIDYNRLMPSQSGIKISGTFSNSNWFYF